MHSVSLLKYLLQVEVAAVRVCFKTGFVVFDHHQ